MAVNVLRVKKNPYRTKHTPANKSILDPVRFCLINVYVGCNETDENNLCRRHPIVFKVQY